MASAHIIMSSSLARCAACTALARIALASLFSCRCNNARTARITSSANIDRDAWHGGAHTVRYRLYNVDARVALARLAIASRSCARIAAHALAYSRITRLSCCITLRARRAAVRAVHPPARFARAYRKQQHNGGVNMAASGITA